MNRLQLGSSHDCDSIRNTDLEVDRRAFIRKAIMASGTLTLANLFGVQSATAVASPDLSLDREHFPGFTHMIQAYGHIRLKKVFTDRLEDLADTVSKNVRAGVGMGLWTEAQADKIDQLLAIIATDGKDGSVKELFKKDFSNFVDHQRVLNACAKLNDDYSIPLPFIAQSTLDTVENTRALHNLESNSLFQAFPGATTLEDLYKVPLPRLPDGTEDANDRKRRAIRHGLKGGIFGSRQAYSLFSLQADAEAFLTTYNGSTKHNNRICAGEDCSDGVNCCPPCPNRYCAHGEGGGCSAMSDTGICPPLIGTP